MMLFEILDLYYLEQVEHDSLYRWNANFLSTVILRAAQDLSSIKQIISEPPHFHPIIIPWKFFSTWNLFKIQFCLCDVARIYQFNLLQHFHQHFPWTLVFYISIPTKILLRLWPRSIYFVTSVNSTNNGPLSWVCYITLLMNCVQDVSSSLGLTLLILGVRSWPQLSSHHEAQLRQIPPANPGSRLRARLLLKQATNQASMFSDNSQRFLIIFSEMRFLQMW